MEEPVQAGAEGDRDAGGDHPRDAAPPGRVAVLSRPMDSRAFLGLRPSHNPYRWSLRGRPRARAPVAASCSAAAASARPSRRWRARAAASACGPPRSTWRTPQPGEVIDVDVTIAVEGHQITQARAVCHVGNREILTVNAALGHRPLEQPGQWEQLPDVLPARRVPDRPHRMPVEGTDPRTARPAPRQGARLRRARRQPGDGQTLVWARIPERARRRRRHRRSAILGDFVPMGVGQALGIHGGGNSLDNTLRVVQPGADRVGAARHPGPRRGARLRPRAGPHVGRGRHAARDGQPELHRADLGPAAPPSARQPTASEVREPDDACPIRPGMTVPLPGPLHSHADELRGAGRPRLHRHLVGRGRRRRRASRPLALAAAWEPRLRLGTAIVPAFTRGAGVPGPVAWPRWPTPRPAGSPSASASSSNVIVERWNGMPFEEPYQQVRDVVRFLRTPSPARR